MSIESIPVIDKATDNDSLRWCWLKFAYQEVLIELKGGFLHEETGRKKTKSFCKIILHWRRSKITTHRRRQASKSEKLRRGKRVKRPKILSRKEVFNGEKQVHY